MNSDIHPSLEFQTNGQESANIGALLRDARLRRGEDLHQISSVLRIRYDYLDAIENDRFEELPGSIYSTGFIRSYSEYLDLDADKIVRRLKSDGTVFAKNTKLVFPAIIPEDGIPGGLIVVLGLIIAVAGYFTWYWSSSSNIFIAKTVPTIPNDLSTPKNPLVAESVIDGKNSLVEASSAVAAPAKLSKKVISPDVKNFEDKLSDVKSELEKPQKDVDTDEAPVTAENSASETKTKMLSRSIDKVIEIKTIGEMQSPHVKLQNEKVLNTSPPDGHKLEENAIIGEKLTPQSTSEIVVTRVSEKIRRPEELVNNVLIGENSTPSLPAKPDPIQAALEDNAPDTLSDLPKRKNIEIAAIPNTPQNFGETENIITPTIPKKINIELQKISRIKLIAKYTSWIQLRDIEENQIIFSKVLLKGQSYNVPNKKGLSLMTGNAGAIEITVDGMAVPKIGKLGEVRRKIILEAKSLKSGQAVIE